MSYSAIYTASKDEAFQGRCLVAARDAANDIMAEDPQTADHANRKAWALNILRGRQTITLEGLAVQILRNATVAANPATALDSDLKFVVVSQLDDLIEIG
jgi:hypothetical protein